MPFSHFSGAGNHWGWIMRRLQALGARRMARPDLDAGRGALPWRFPAELSTLRRIFVHFPQVRLAALDVAILFHPFGGKVFDRLGDLPFYYFFLELFVEWTH